MSYTRLKKIIFKTYVEYLIIAIGLGLIIRMVVLSPYKIPSDSMSPTLEKGDFVFAYTLPFGFKIPFSQEKLGKASLPRREDIVLYRYELDKQSLFIKRVAGLPGDKIEIQKGTLLVNEKQAKTLPEQTSLEPFLVPQGSLFLIGDNPAKSDDLQYWSVISKERVLGRIQWIWLSVDQVTNAIRWDRILKTVE